MSCHLNGTDTQGRRWMGCHLHDTTMCNHSTTHLHTGRMVYPMLCVFCNEILGKENLGVSGRDCKYKFLGNLNFLGPQGVSSTD